MISKISIGMYIEWKATKPKTSSVKYVFVIYYVLKFATAQVIALFIDYTIASSSKKLRLTLGIHSRYTAWFILNLQKYKTVSFGCIAYSETEEP